LVNFGLVACQVRSQAKPPIPHFDAMRRADGALAADVP
jgi:hypothetical protein